MGGPFLGFPGSARGNEPACQCRKHKRCGFDPWLGKMPWRRGWQPLSSILAWRIPQTEELAGYSPQVAKTWTRMKQLSMHIRAFPTPDPPGDSRVLCGCLNQPTLCWELPRPRISETLLLPAESQSKAQEFWVFPSRRAGQRGCAHLLADLRLGWSCPSRAVPRRTSPPT